MRTIPGEQPEEQCSLEPQRQCKHVTKLVPQLKPHESCTDVPKEVCTRSQTNPRKVQKPVLKKWCYEATPESGLEPEGQGSSKAEPADAPPQCSPTCLRNIRNNVCRPECNVPECPPCSPPPPTCSAKCLGDIRKNICSRECDVSECPPCSAPPPPKTTPRPAPTCSNTCLNNIRNKVCRPECNVPECPPCSSPSCSSTCLRNIKNNICKPECNVAECPPCSAPPPPTCSATCKRNIKNNICSPECNVRECPPCSAPAPTCSAKCLRNIKNNICSPACEVPECPTCTVPLDLGYLPPPASNSVSDAVKLRRPQERARSSGGRATADTSRTRRPTANAPRTRRPTARKFARQQKAPSAANSRSRKLSPAPVSKKSTNWDVLFSAGVIKNRSRSRLRTART